MGISRRHFLQILSATGATVSADFWLVSRLEAYAKERIAYQSVRGPGFASFSRSVCRDCANHCSLALRKMDELPVGLRGTRWHPASRGSLCPAGQSQMQALFDPDRLERPLMRADAGAPARPAEWDEALGELRDHLAVLVSSGKGERITVVDGRTTSLGTLLLEAWVRSIPGARYIPLRIENALDRLARDFLGGAHGGRLRFDLAKTGTLLLVGSELLEIDGSPVSQMRAHGERRRDPRLDHAPTLSLAPRQGPTAVHGDLWIPCRPGQERDILLAFAEALSRGHPRRSSLFPEYARLVPEARDPVSFARRHSLESVAQRYGLRGEDMEAAVRALEKFGPAVCLPGPGLLRRFDGFAHARAALALNLWTGGFATEGGLSWGWDPLFDVAGQLGLADSSQRDPRALSDMLRPLFEIKRSPVDVLLCVEANLAHELPGRDQIARALSHIPFVASFSGYEDETARLSHVTLPTLQGLESWDLPAPAWGVPEAFLQVQRPALVPVVEARTVEDIVLGLASEGVAGASFSPPASDAQGIVKAAVDILVASGRGEIVGPNGRSTLASMSAASATRALLSADAIWVAPSQPGPKSRHREAAAPGVPPPAPDLAPDQLWLVPFDSPAIQSGRVLNRPMMMEMSGMLHGLAWESWLEIHPDDARRRGLETGDRLKVRGPRAEILSRAVVTRGVAPAVVAAPVGFGHEALGSVAAGVGGNPMELPAAVFDDETGVPAWGPIPVFVVKV